MVAEWGQVLPITSVIFKRHKLGINALTRHCTAQILASIQELRHVSTTIDDG